MEYYLKKKNTGCKYWKNDFKSTIAHHKGTKMEEIFKGILESMPYPIVFVNPEHKIIYINKRADEVYHQDNRRPHILGRSIFDCHKEEDSRQKIIELVERFLDGGGEEFLTTNKRNEKIFVTPVRNRNGEFLGYYERFEPIRLEPQTDS